MEQKKTQPEELEIAVSKLVNVVVTFFVIILFLMLLFVIFVPKDYSPIFTKDKTHSPQKPVEEIENNDLVNKKNDNFWKAPLIDTIKDNKSKELINYGKELIVNTSLYFGPNGKIFNNYSNGMNCQNCHLDAGAKIFGNNYSAVSSTYPKYRARSGTIENIYKRINDCFERSLNGKPLDSTSKEMQAIISYINWIGSNIKKGNKAEGSGLKEISFLDRPADPEKGKIIYEQKCQLCHQSNGEGVLNSDKTAYTYPPLWGEYSYNDGAGIYRLSNFAKFVKYNMPQGASHDNPQLSDEEAWDVAAFVNSQDRPHKNISKDWPNIKEKPFDHPFGPFRDEFTESQHKYGPFQAIKSKKQKG